MNKSSNLSQTKTFVLGSSSPLSKAIDNDGRSGETHFFGRTNPHQFDNWVNIDGFKDEADIESFKDQFSEYVRTVINPNVSQVNLIFVIGVSSHNWQESFTLNELLPAIISQAFIAIIKDAGIKGGASIGLIGSTGSYRGAKLPYSATKASLTGIMHSLNRDSSGIVRTNLIIPTAFNGGMISDWDEDKRKAVASSNVINRIGDVGEIADAIMFAATNQFVAESVINMSAGQVNIE